MKTFKFSWASSTLYFEVFDVFEILQIYLNTNTNTHNM